MSERFWLSPKQLLRIGPFLPRSRGRARVDDLRVISGIVHVIRSGMRWCDAPLVYGSYKTLYNRFIRWSRAGVFERIFAAIADESSATETVMIDTTHVKAHRTAASLRKDGDEPRHLGRTKGGLNTKIHVVCEAIGRPLRLLLTAGQVSDFKGAASLLDDLPNAQTLIADKGYDSDWFRDGLIMRGIRPCIPGRSNRKLPISYDKEAYRERNRIERLFCRLKDWRRLAIRYDRCAHAFMSAVALAATFIFWL